MVVEMPESSFVVAEREKDFAELNPGRSLSVGHLLDESVGVGRDNLVVGVGSGSSFFDGNFEGRVSSSSTRDIHAV